MARTVVRGGFLLAAALSCIAPGTARAQTTWDLVGLAGAGGSYGTSRTISDGLFGSVTLYSFGTSPSWPYSSYNLYGKDYGNSLPDAEKGVGLCTPYYDYCYGSPYEIGDFTGGGIIMGLNLASGVTFSGFTLSSVQNGDAWKVYYKTTGTCNGSTSWSGASSYSGAGNGSNNPGSLVYQASGANCFKFVDGGDGDYLLQSIKTTSISPVPEPATMTLLAAGLVALAGVGRRKRNK